MAESIRLDEPGCTWKERNHLEWYSDALAYRPELTNAERRELIQGAKQVICRCGLAECEKYTEVKRR